MTRGRWILGPILALALGLTGLIAGLQAPARTALSAQSDLATTTPAAGRNGGKDKSDKDKSPAPSLDNLVAAFHTGNCRNPDEPAAFTLAALTPQIDDAGTPTAQGASPQGTLSTPPLATGSGSTATSFDSLFAAQPYVLVVHAGTDATGPAVACGDVAGVVVNGQLALALRPVGDNDVAGLAVLVPTNDGGTAGTVFVFAELKTKTADKAAKTPRAKGAAQGAGGGSAKAARKAARGQGGQGAGPSGGPGADITGGIGAAGQPAATRVPRVRRTRTTAQPAGTPPAATVAPTTAPTAASTAPSTVGTPPVATEPTGLQTPAATETTGVNAQATVSAIETATIATVSPPTAVVTNLVAPTPAAATESQPTVATSDVVAPTEAAPAEAAPAEEPAETAPQTAGTPPA
ncbi:MAG TPA: hypothetical protein VFI22_09170 [Thermomicrobiales bacterium]|nr:hypothetical protein [Thermomicrobiales bacterium]